MFSSNLCNMFVFLGINYATKGTAYQESTYGTLWPAEKANDGIIESGFSNTLQSKAGEWWKVDLGKKIIFQFARIYARDGTCDGNPCGMIFTLIMKAMLLK